MDDDVAEVGALLHRHGRSVADQHQLRGRFRLTATNSAHLSGGAGPNSSANLPSGHVGAPNGSTAAHRQTERAEVLPAADG